MVRGLSTSRSGSVGIGASRLWRMSMRTRLTIAGILLLILVVSALFSGVSRLGPSDLSPRALKTASRWVDRIPALSDRSEEIATSVVLGLDFSQYLTSDEKEIGSIHGGIRQSVLDQVRAAGQERRLAWRFDDPVALSETKYEIGSRTTVPIQIRIQYVLDGSQRTFEASGHLDIQIVLLVDADQKKVLSWRVGKDTTINLELGQ